MLTQTVFKIKPFTDEAQAWLQENVIYGDFQWQNGWLVIEHGYIGDIVANMLESGLRLRIDFVVM